MAESEGLEEHYGEYKEVKRYIKVTRETRWGKNWQHKEVLAIRMVQRKPKNPTWNDMYFPVTIRIPMFYEHSSTEITVPPRPAGRVALDLLKGEKKG